VSDRPPVIEQVLSGSSILVVEDHDDSRTALTLTLTSFGAQVVATGTATEALEAIDRQWPDVVLTAIGLPDMDGRKLFDTIQARAKSEGVTPPPIIAITAFTNPAIHAEIYTRGFRALLVKPVDPQALLETIRHALS
jgi:CheY-like chemotaxis protein